MADQVIEAFTDFLPVLCGIFIKHTAADCDLFKRSAVSLNAGEAGDGMAKGAVGRGCVLSYAISEMRLSVHDLECVSKMPEAHFRRI